VSVTQKKTIRLLLGCVRHRAQVQQARGERREDEGATPGVAAGLRRDDAVANGGRHQPPHREADHRVRRRNLLRLRRNCPGR